MNNIRGKRPPAWSPVPPAQAAMNRKQEQATANTSAIASAIWGVARANVGQSVPYIVQLRRPVRGTATIELFFNARDGRVFRLEEPMQVQVMGTTINGSWSASAASSLDWSQGTFQFQVKIGTDLKSSNLLTMTYDAVGRVVRRNNTDGFDG